MGISLLFVDTERVWRGGQDQLFTLIRGLHRRGHEVHLICYPGTLLEERIREIGVSLYPIAIRSELGLLWFWRLWVLMRRLHPDIVAFNTPRPVLLGKLASRLARVPARILFRRVNFPIRKNLLSRLKYNWSTDGIIAISESIRRKLVEAGVPASRVHLVYEGLDLTYFPRRESPAPRNPSDRFIVGTVGYLSREKGHHSMVEAAALIPDVQSRMRFVIVGDGECRQELENLVRERGLEGCFDFTGFQNRTSKYIKSFDLFVLPSLSEGLSSAILSAMAASLPVIATNVGGVPELVKSGETGLLVSPADPVAMAQAIRRLADDPSEAFRMGQEGRRQMEARFTLDRKILETEQLCWSFVRRPGPASRAVHA